MSRETGIPLLAQLPIDIELRKGGDRGVPLMMDNPDSITGQVFQEVAAKVAALEGKTT